MRGLALRVSFITGLLRLQVLANPCKSLLTNVACTRACGIEIRLDDNLGICLDYKPALRRVSRRGTHEMSACATGGLKVGFANQRGVGDSGYDEVWKAFCNPHV